MFAALPESLYSCLLAFGFTRGPFLCLVTTQLMDAGKTLSAVCGAAVKASLEFGEPPVFTGGSGAAKVQAACSETGAVKVPW